MDPLSATASIIAVIQLTGSVVSAVYNYRKGVKNAPEDAAKIIRDLTGLSQILEKLLQMIEKERSTKAARLACLNDLVKPDGPLASCQKTLGRLNTKLQPESGWRAVKQSLIWPLKQDYVRKNLDEIATAKATLELALTVDQISLALETKDGVDALASSFESFRFDEKRKAVLSRLSPTDATMNHMEACRKHQRGTGDWFIKSAQYSDWVGTIDSVMWISGIPGCGKTILCSVAIENLLQKHRYNTPRSAVAYYYFNFQTKAEQQFVNLLRSLILQLSCQSLDICASVDRLTWQADSDIPSEHLMGVVEEVLESFQEVFVVIDAFDECEQSEDVLRWFQKLLGVKDVTLHLLVSSRQDHRFRGVLEAPTTSNLAIDEHTFEKDIQLHVQEQLSTHSRMMRWSPSVHRNIEQSLLANAGGLFRWVDCQLDLLRKCLRVSNIKDVLDSPPKTLHETYERIITSIDEAYIEDASRILQWLAFSARPLRVNELNEILAFDRSDPEHPCFNPDLRLPLLEDVLTLCSSLVRVSSNKATGQSDSKIESLEVSLAHNSVKDYLISRENKIGPSVQLPFEAQLANSVMAGCCVVYLLQFQSKMDMATLQVFPLAPYAAEFWTEHYRRSAASDTAFLDRLALRLLTAKTAYRNCCCLYNPDKRWRGMDLEKDPGPPALYYASLTGLSRMIKLLVADGSDPKEEAVGSYHGEALSAAAYQGDKDSVQALLSANANLDGVWEGEYGSPIASAASQGHNEIVTLLLRAGADVDKNGGDGQGQALFHAVFNRHLETVAILLKAGASADAFTGMSGVTFAIEIAAQRCDREFVLLLFPRVSDWGAEKVLSELVRAGHRALFETLLQTQRGRRSGLQYAAQAGRSDLVQSMVDDSSRDANYESSATAAFRQAAASGSLEAMQILYENRPENAVSDEELSACVASAASHGHSLVVKYLLDRGADFRSATCQGALVTAAENGYLSTVQVLLTAGVNPNSHIKVGQQEEESCLWTAVNREHVDITRLLLDYGADPDTWYRERSAFDLSIDKANDALFDLLLEKGASTTIGPIKGARYDTRVLPVHSAAASGNVHILRSLLKAGFEADSVLIPDGWTAVFHAAKAGHEKVLRILINDCHADINRRANKGTVAIHTAAYHNHTKCIEVFLDAGVDVGLRDQAGRTALYWAAQKGSVDAVRLLLERSANVFIEDKDTFMKAADIAKAKALEALELQERGRYWGGPLKEDYERILKMLAEQSHRS